MCALGRPPCGFAAPVTLLSPLCLRACLSHPQAYGFWHSRVQVPFVPLFFIITGSALLVYSFNSKKKTQNRDQMAHLLLKLIALSDLPPCQPGFKG